IPGAGRNRPGSAPVQRRADLRGAVPGPRRHRRRARAAGRPCHRPRRRPVKLATIRTPAGTAAVRVDGDTAIEVGVPDVGALLADPGWRKRAAAADGSRHMVGALDYAPVVPRPGKIVCVGLNYRAHIQEMGRELPAYPTLFAKFAE